MRHSDESYSTVYDVIKIVQFSIDCGRNKRMHIMNSSVYSYDHCEPRW